MRTESFFYTLIYKEIYIDGFIYDRPIRISKAIDQMQLEAPREMALAQQGQKTGEIKKLLRSIYRRI